MFIKFKGTVIVFSKWPSPCKDGNAGIKRFPWSDQKCRISDNLSIASLKQEMSKSLL